MLIFGLIYIFEPVIYMMVGPLIIFMSITTLCCSYYFVWKAFRQSGERLAQISNASNQEEERKRFERERKLVHKVLTLIGFYIAAYVPTLIYVIILFVDRTRLLSQDILVYATLITSYVGLTNSCCNPFIYVWKDARFRTACKRFLLKRDATAPPTGNNGRTQTSNV